MARLLQKSLKLRGFRRRIGRSTRGKINQNRRRVHRALKPCAAPNPEQLVTASVGNCDTQQRNSQGDYESDFGSAHVAPPVDYKKAVLRIAGLYGTSEGLRVVSPR